MPMQALKNRRVKKKENKGKKILWITVPILGLYIILCLYYNNHFYMNTKINGVKVSNMTVGQVEEAINKEINSYSLTLKGRNELTTRIDGRNIDLHTLFDESLTDIIAQQKGLAWPLNLFKSHNININTMLKFDESKLNEQIDNLVFFKEKNVVWPINAYISEYGDNGYEIVPDTKGAKVDKDKLHEEIQRAIMSLEPNLSLEDSSCYEEAIITSSDPGLVAAMNELNKIAGTKITYEFGDDIEILDINQISEWLSVDENNKVVLSHEKVKEYVDYIGKTYNTFGKTRTFKTSYGKVIEIRGGDYGWWLDRATEVSELKELIMEGKQQIKEPSYYQVAQQYGDDDIGDTYIEVNLTAQHLFFYKDGKLIVETDFVSGNLSKDYGTPTGTFPVQYKERDATLKGENYATPVKYWMPYNGNIGFHDAPWRNEFGGNIYETKGSHGCVNMPPAAAKAMFDNIQRGVAVLVYELPGTENHNKDKNKDEIKVPSNTQNKKSNKDS
jgi:hypothetical protein